MCVSYITYMFTFAFISISTYWKPCIHTEITSPVQRHRLHLRNLEFYVWPLTSVPVFTPIPNPHLCMHDLTPHRPQISMPGCPWCSDTCLAILGLWYPIPGRPSRETACSPYLGFDKPYWLAPRNGCPHPAEALTAPLLSALNALSRTSCLHSGGPLHPEATPLWECPPCPAQDLVVTSRLPIWVLSLHTKLPLHISAPCSAWTVSSSFPGCCAPPPWGRPPHPAWT